VNCRTTTLTKLILTEAFCCLILMFGWLLAFNERAYAIEENINDTIPKEITDAFYRDTNCNGEGHAQYVWVSPPGGAGYNRVEIEEGKDSTGNLWLNTITGTCAKIISSNGTIIDKTLKTTRSRVTRATASIGNLKLIGDLTELNYNCSQLFNLRWVKICDQNDPLNQLSIYPSHNDFELTGLSGLGPGIYNVVLKFQNRLVHRYDFDGRGEFRCVARPPDGSLWYALDLDGFRGFQNDPNICPSTPTEVTLTIEVKSTPKFDISVDVPICNADSGTILFGYQNNGDGDSKYDGENGVLSQYKVERTRNGIKSILTDSSRSRIILSPGGKEVFVYTIEPSQIEAGDIITSSLSVDPTKGRTGGAVLAGNITKSQSAECSYRAKPYFKVYGGDIVVGKPFVQNGQCSATKTNAPVTANYFSDGRGAGAQFAISAINKIDANSSMLRLRPSAPPPKTPIDLSFGNYENSNKVSIGSAWKDLGAFQGCIADYIEYYNNNKAGFKTLSNTFSKDSNKNLYYRDGDLSITENINPVSTEWSKIEDIKTNVVIVKGDINIDPDVTELNGIFIALPRDDGTGGTINTCKVSNDSQQFAECNQKLTVFGSFIANDVELRRIKGAKLTATTNEQANSNNIAEVFQYVPELYISGSNSFTSDQTEQKIPDGYDSVISLPPFL